MTDYFYVSGSDEADTPSAVAIDFTDDVEWRVDVALGDYTPATTKYWIGRYTIGGDNRVFRLGHTSSGFISLSVSDDGTGAGIVTFSSSTAPSPQVDGTRYHFRITLDADNGSSDTEVNFYYRQPALGQDLANDDNWILVGVAQTNTGIWSWKATPAADLSVGSDGGGNFMPDGGFYRGRAGH